MKKSVAVLGLGRFGKSLAENLYRLGADVLVADSNEALVQDFSGKCTSAVCAIVSATILTLILLPCVDWVIRW